MISRICRMVIVPLNYPSLNDDSSASFDADIFSVCLVFIFCMYVCQPACLPSYQLACLSVCLASAPVYCQLVCLLVCLFFCLSFLIPLPLSIAPNTTTPPSIISWHLLKLFPGRKISHRTV